MSNLPTSDNTSCDIEEPSGNHPIIVSLKTFETLEGFDEDVHNYLVESLGRYIVENSMYRSSSYRGTLDFVYGLNDNEIYSVLSAPHDGHYDFFVVHSDYFHPRSSSYKHFNDIRMKCANFLKGLNRYEGQALSLQFKLLSSSLNEIHDSFVYTSRRAVGLREVPEVVYPSVEKLKLFYECKRKVRYSSCEEALKSCFDYNEVYHCNHGDHFHQGRPPQVAPEDADPEKVIKRYQLTWNRYLSAGRFNKNVFEDD